MFVIMAVRESDIHTNVAVISSEKKRGVIHFFFVKMKIKLFLFQKQISWLPSNKSNNTKYLFPLQYQINLVFGMFL